MRPFLSDLALSVLAYTCGALTVFALLRGEIDRAVTASARAEAAIVEADDAITAARARCR